VLEGISAEVVSTCSGGAVLTGWALYVRANPITLGLIVALPQAAQLVQVPAAWITSRFGSRRTALWAVGAGRQALLLLCLLPWVPADSGAREALLVVAAALSTALAVIGNNAWVAWMGELVPPRIRGRYFGGRTAVATIANATGSLLAGFTLDWARSRNMEGQALASLAFTAALGGAASSWLMARQHACVDHHANDGLTRDILAPWRNTRARRLLGFQLAWNAAVGLSASFFTAFMLRDLGLTFVTVATYGAITATCRVAVAPLWGRAIDRVGPGQVAVLCSIAIASLPLLWVFASPGVTWPLTIDALATGLFWSGHSLATFQLPLAIAPRRGRPYYLAAFSMSAGIAFLIATELGGAIVTRWASGARIGGLALGPYQLLFVTSSLARFAAAALSLRLLESRGRAGISLAMSEADA
jgi:MFS family permease